MIPIYINADHLEAYLVALRKNRGVNTSPDTDRVLLSITTDIMRFPHPFMFDWFTVGECRDCKWFANRTQKCTCCRRNRTIKDCYEQKDGGNENGDE